MKKLILLFTAIFGFNTYAQIVPFTVNLDTSLTKTLDSAMLYVKNPTNKTANVTQVRNTSAKFFTRVNSFSINPNDSAGVWVIFSSNQNLTYRSFLIFEVSVPAGGLKYSLVYGMLATAKYPDVLYAFTQGLIDENLKTALKTFTSSPYTQLGYNTARDRMFETVDDYGGDTIECVYSGRKIKAVTRTEAQNQSFDTEHTWPQGTFNMDEPMRSDLNHLFPTYSPANNARGNYPFGYVVSNITYQDGGSKRGNDAFGTIVFEPRDIHKGNVARAMFYFILRHQNWESYLALNQETALRQFNTADTVDARERLRNDRVKQFQNNRNPFADHPEMIERIRVFYTSSPTPSLPDITASPFTVRFDTVQNAGDTVSYFLSIFNFGNANLTISGITSNNGVFTVVNFPSVIPPNRYGLAQIKFTPTAINQNYNGELTINNNDSTIKVNLQGVCGSPIGITQISNQVPEKFSLAQNYPNPFNPATKIRFGIPTSGNVKLMVYDILGREVSVLVNHTLSPGSYEMSFDASNIPSGVYFYRLYTGEFTNTKRMMLLR
jgi:hypothetical protein